MSGEGTSARDWKRTPGGARLGRGTIVTLMLIVVAFALAVVFAFRFIDGERDRAMHRWQVRLGILADGRAAAVDTWLKQQRAELAALSGNLSLRVYVTQILQSADPTSAEAQYLKNLLIVTAERTGYTAPARGANVPANVRRQGVAGLAIVATDRRILAATDYAPALDARLRRFLASAPAGRVAMLDLYAGAGGLATVAFAAPVTGPQGGDRIATVLGVKPVADQLYPLLKPPGIAAAGAEALLVRRDGDVVIYLSPLADGTAPLDRRLATNTPALAAARALDRPGAFVDLRDYRGRAVLATSRRIDGTNWVLVFKVDRAEALGPTEARLNRLLIILLLALAVALIAVAALWRHGASRRAAIAAARYRETADALAEQRDLLRVVLDSQPAAVFMTDEAGRLRFANAAAGTRAGMAPGDMPGKTLTAVFGAAAARPYQRLNLQALETGSAAREVRRRETGDGAAEILLSMHVPVAAGREGPGVLVVEEDVTGAILEREKRERTLAALTRTILTLIDRRDPNAAHQSARVARVGEAIAREMGLPDNQVEATATAGSLTNIGKLLVPTDLLTKPGPLSADELERVRDAIDQGPALLSGVEFDAPVVEALEAVRERWDGGGAAGLAGDAIPELARIVAVANAFVAMASPRAHRPAMDLDAAVAALQAEAGAAFDRRVVSALANWLDNRGGRAAWAADTASRTA